MNKIDLLIFDFDGVIVDSEHLSSAVLAETLQQVGVPLGQDDINNQFTGLDFASMMSQLVIEYGQEKIDLFADKIEDNYAQKMQAELQLIPHILAFLQTTKLAFCIASNSKMQRLMNNQQTTAIKDIFDGKTYSADMVAKPKPAPDLFLYAAQQMGYTAETCLVIEDGTHGIKAATAANMRSIGFTGGSHCKDGHATRLTNAGALHVFNNMSELANIISNL